MKPLSSLRIAINFLHMLGAIQSSRISYVQWQQWLSLYKFERVSKMKEQDQRNDVATHVATQTHLHDTWRTVTSKSWRKPACSVQRWTTIPTWSTVQILSHRLNSNTDKRLQLPQNNTAIYTATPAKNHATQWYETNNMKDFTHRKNVSTTPRTPLTTSRIRHLQGCKIISRRTHNLRA